MSVTTSSREDVSLRIRTYEQGGAMPTAQQTGRRQSSPTVFLHGMERLVTLVPPLVLAVILLVSWYTSTAYGHVSSLFLPAPGDVLTSLISGLSSGLLVSNALITIEESLLGFLLALAIALPIGYGLAKSRLFAAAVQPYLAAGQAIPAIVIAPLLVIWIGYGLLPITILCMLIVIFPMVITIAFGVQTIDKTLTDAARVEGAHGWPLLASIEFPLALPAILAAVRTGLTLSITGAMVGEFVISGGQGLGSLVVQAGNQFNTALLFATLIVLATLAGLYYGASWLLVKLAEAIY
ncbi:MAG TPA: ABC transporter permease [Ktedonobacteraceae bacterium]|nr:ABC transporter permease [Ktedonobacteraceae bacterium]